MLLAEMLFEAKEIFSDDLIYVPLNNFPRFTISKEKYLKKKKEKKKKKISHTFDAFSFQ